MSMREERYEETQCTETSESETQQNESTSSFYDMFLGEGEAQEWLNAHNNQQTMSRSPARSARYLPSESSSEGPESSDDDAYYLSKFSRRAKNDRIKQGRNKNEDKLSLSNVDLSAMMGESGGHQGQTTNKRFRGRKPQHQDEARSLSSDSEEEKPLSKKHPTHKRAHKSDGGLIRHRGRRYRVAVTDNTNGEKDVKTENSRVMGRISIIEPTPPTKEKLKVHNIKHQAPPEIDIISPSPTLSTSSSPHERIKHTEGEVQDFIPFRPSRNLPLLKMVLGAATAANAKGLLLQPPHKHVDAGGTSSSSGTLSPASMRCASSHSTSSDGSNTSPLPPLKRTPVIRRRNLLPPILYGDSSTSSRNSSPASIDSPVFTPLPPSELGGWTRPVPPDAPDRSTELCRSPLDTEVTPLTRAPQFTKPFSPDRRYQGRQGSQTEDTGHLENIIIKKDSITGNIIAKSKRKQSTPKSPSLTQRSRVSESWRVGYREQEGGGWEYDARDHGQANDWESNSSLDVVAPSSPPRFDDRRDNDATTGDVRLPQLPVRGPHPPVNKGRKVSLSKSAQRFRMVPTPGDRCGGIGLAGVSIVGTRKPKYSLEEKHSSSLPSCDGKPQQNRTPKRNTAPTVMTQTQGRSRPLGQRLLKRRIASCEENDPALRDFRRVLRSFSIDSPISHTSQESREGLFSTSTESEAAS